MAIIFVRFRTFKLENKNSEIGNLIFNNTIQILKNI